MAHIKDKIEEILRNNICGYHEYTFGENRHISYASSNLCDMLGVQEGDLLSENEDRYISFVHQKDKASYKEFMENLSTGACERKSLRYRLVIKGGTVIYVNDTIFTQQDGDVLKGYSTLSDITQMKSENSNLTYLNDTIPCGFVKYTCEKEPHITYINRQMLEMIGANEIKGAEIDYSDLYWNNIYFLIPFEERRRFAHYLEQVYQSGAPIAGEITIMRCDGSKIRVFGWVTKCVNENGSEEYQSVCIDISQRYEQDKARELDRYLKALTDVYDMIFKYDFTERTVSCLCSDCSTVFHLVKNVPMQMHEATNKWVEDCVCGSEKQSVHEFFNLFFKESDAPHSSAPNQIIYHAKATDGTLKTYTGIFITVDSAVKLFCARNLSGEDEAILLKNENASLRRINQNMQELCMHFTDGIAAFEIVNDFVTPLYASDNICNFFGYTREEWLNLMKVKTPIKDFIGKKITYKAVLEFIENGEAEFVYFDIETQTTRKIKVICSQKDDTNSVRYVMMYRMDTKEASKAESAENKNTVKIRTFGYFDVFVGNRPIAFKSQKAKELFAILVDRRGGFVSSDEAISFLWPEEPSNSVTLARYRKVALRLKNILGEYAISDIMESVDGKRRIVVDKVDCDLYNYLSGQKEYAHLFKGSYLSNYSWAETTLGELSGEIY